jgi:hypothetical protein
MFENEAMKSERRFLQKFGLVFFVTGLVCLTSALASPWLAVFFILSWTGEFFGLDIGLFLLVMMILFFPALYVTGTVLMILSACFGGMMIRCFSVVGLIAAIVWTLQLGARVF